jgi:hypothetical protein
MFDVEQNCTNGGGGNAEVLDTEMIVKSAEQKVRRE